MKNKKLIIVGIISVLTLAIGVCFGIYKYTPRVTAVTLPESMDLLVGDTQSISIQYTFNRELSDEEKSKAIKKFAAKLSVDNSNVLELSDNSVKAVGVGTAVVSVESETATLKAFMNCTVRNPLTGFNILGLGEDSKLTTTQLVQTLTPEWEPVPKDAVFNPDDVTLSLMPGAAEGVVEVDPETNQLKVVGAGETTMLLQCEGISKDFQVRVLRTPSEIFIEDGVSLWVGNSHTMSVWTDIDNPECGTTYEFASSDDSIVSVDANGVVTGHASGSATITVTNEYGSLATTQVEVISYPLTYNDDTCSITIAKEQYAGTWCYIAHVSISDYSRFGTSCGRGVYGGSETTSSAAARLGAILTINGDWAAPQLGYRVARSGQLCSDGSCYSEAVYSRANGLLSYPASIGIQGANLGSLVAAGTVSDTFQFGPAFLLNGGVISGGGSSRAQRTFIGTSGAPGDIWMVVTEGRYSDGVSAGLTHTECAQLLQSKGCTFGVPLDGGGSSTMVFRGMRLNSVKSERSVVDFVYVR